MPIEKDQAENWVSEFAESTPFSFLEGPQKEHAASFLVEFLVKAEELNEENVRRVMLERMPELAIPEEPRSSVPDVVGTFLEWLQDSGHTADGNFLAKFVRALGPAYRERCAPGGGIRIPPMVKKTSDIGRNDPCPCGSGKKYKKCCGGRS